MLIVENLTIAYPKCANIVSGFNLSLPSGQILAMLGLSGSGKTSILKAIAGLIPIKSGIIKLDNALLAKHKQLVSPERRNIGMVFQDYGLFPHLTVAQNIGFGLKKFNNLVKKQRIGQLLSLVNLSGIEQKYPHQLSGGQQQRVSLVRSLAIKPKVLLLDEPFSNLDNKHKIPLIAQVRQILKQEQMSTIFVTHQQNEADMLADNQLFLTDKQHNENLDNILSVTA